jgi:hypothetical protein
MNTTAKLGEIFPIWRDAEQLIVSGELAMRQFSRYYKYTLAIELREIETQVLSYVNHAINQKERRP